MDFRKKLKIRLYLALSYIVLGVALIVIFNIANIKNEFLSYCGFALLVIGIARTRNYFLITKNEESITKKQIAETDERNISIANRAKSVAFYVYVLLSCVAVIALELFEKTELATFVSATVCVLIIIYWVSYLIINKIS